MTEPEYLWFLDTLVTPKIPARSGEDQISILESYARRGDSPPLHIHDEDEVFCVLSGEITVNVDGEERLLRAGDTAIGPKGLVHSYRVESNEARWLVVTTGGRFESFVRSLAREAPGPELPPASSPPTDEQVNALRAAAERHGIQLVGPPLQ